MKNPGQELVHIMLASLEWYFYDDVKLPIPDPDSSIIHFISLSLQELQLVNSDKHVAHCP